MKTDMRVSHDFLLTFLTLMGGSHCITAVSTFYWVRQKKQDMQSLGVFNLTELAYDPQFLNNEFERSRTKGVLVK